MFALTLYAGPTSIFVPSPSATCGSSRDFCLSAPWMPQTEEVGLPSNINVFAVTAAESDNQQVASRSISRPECLGAQLESNGTTNWASLWCSCISWCSTDRRSAPSHGCQGSHGSRRHIWLLRTKRWSTHEPSWSLPSNWCQRMQAHEVIRPHSENASYSNWVLWNPLQDIRWALFRSIHPSTFSFFMS